MSELPPLTRVLSANPFLGGLGTEAVSALAALGVTTRLDSDQTLFLKGDPGDALYAVRRGGIRIASGTEGGRRLTLNILGAGDVFGEVALIDGRCRTADAIATEPTDLFMLRRRDFLELLVQRPGVALRFAELLCERVRWLTERMEEAVLMPLPARLARRIIALAEDFGAEVAVSQEELAVFVGASRETVNRQLQVWRRQNLIDLHRGRIEVLDAEGLAESAESEGAS